MAPKIGGPWKSLCAKIQKISNSMNLALNGLRKKIGNGLQTLFWLDSWLGPSPLKQMFPRLFTITTHQQASVNSLGF